MCFEVHRENCDIGMLVSGKPAWSVEMLAVLVVLTLIPAWSDGVLVKKCELKSLLEAAFSGLQEEMAKDIIAKCKRIRLIIGINNTQVKLKTLMFQKRHHVTLCDIVTNI